MSVFTEATARIITAAQLKATRQMQASGTLADPLSGPDNSGVEAFGFAAFAPV